MPIYGNVRAVLSVVPELQHVFSRALHRPPSTYGARITRGVPPHLPREAGKTKGDHGPNERDQRPRPGIVSDRSGRAIPTSSKRLADLPNRTRIAKTAAPDPLKSLPRRNTNLPHSAVELAKPKPFTDFPLNQGLIDVLPTLLEGSDRLRTTPIQSITLSNLLDRPRDALLAAETGSGKTLAYMLPLLHHLKATDNYSSPIPTSSPSDPGPAFLSDYQVPSNQLLPRSLVISPTHELTRQTTSVAKALSHGIKLSVIGMSNTLSGIGTRRVGVDVLIGTSGGFRRGLGIKREGDEMDMRIRDRERRERKVVDEYEEDDVGAEEQGGGRGRKERAGPKISLEKVEWVVIDEADVLLGPSFISETTSILSLLPPSAKLLLCTATLPPSLLTALSSHLLLSDRDIQQYLAPGLHKLPSGVKTRFPGDTGGHLAARVVREVKDAFAEDAQEERSDRYNQGGRGHVSRTKAVVFCNTDNRAREVVRKFKEKEPDLGVLEWTTTGDTRLKGSQGDLAPFLSSSLTTTRAISRSPGSDSEPRILITTSLLSRGLDFNDRVRTVVLVDPPRDTLDFVHRAGRTGRAGRGGRVIVFGMGGSVSGGRGLKGRGKVGEGMAGVLRRR